MKTFMNIWEFCCIWIEHNDLNIELFALLLDNSCLFSSLLNVVQVTCIENGFAVVIITVTTIADYYIVAGVVYQAPDLQSVINSRVVGGLLYI